MASSKDAEMDRVYREIVGVDPSKSSSESDLQAQRKMIATVVFNLAQRCEPLTLIQMLLAGACWFADGKGVSRDQLARLCREISMGDNTLVFDPSKVG